MTSSAATGPLTPLRTTPVACDSSAGGSTPSRVSCTAQAPSPSVAASASSPTGKVGGAGTAEKGASVGSGGGSTARKLTGGVTPTGTKAEVAGPAVGSSPGGGNDEPVVAGMLGAIGGCS